MNDARDPIEDLEPLDPNALGLLAAYRGAAGPSPDAEARMLAGLHARLEAESSEPSGAATVSDVSAQTNPHQQRSSSNVRTLAVAAVAFAAGVALTVSLRQPSVPESPLTTANDDASQVVRAYSPAASGRVQPDAYTPSGEPSASMVPVPRALEPVHSWPLSIADLVKPRPPTESGLAQDPTTRSVEPTKPGAPSEATEPTTPGRNAAGDTSGSRGHDRTEGATPSAGPSGGSAPGVEGRGAAIQGAWAPSVSTGPSGVGTGSAARNPAGAGPAPSNGNNASSNSGGDGSGDKPPSADKEPSPTPSDEPSEEPEAEDPEDPEDSEQLLEERCTEELDDCLADADAFCEFGYPGCDSVHEFCFMRSMTCLGAEGGGFDPQLPPDAPEPDDCDTDYGICMMEADAMCVVEKLPPQECEERFWQCDEFLATCYGDPPPEPPW